ncbi:MAG: organic solvent tolerance ABC transporter substrate-binding protein [Candidatus Binatia bacterium]|nr:MAG: organic solvent tolerance ABC transporter substrate-binding protein [Candidatus Binatia bacterium]
MRSRLLASCLALLACLVPRVGAEVPGPTATVRELLATIRQVKENPATEEERRAQRRAVESLHRLLAFSEVARFALARQWDTLGAAQRNEFLALLRELFEKIAYPKSASFFEDLEIEFDGERIEDSTAEVSTTVHHPEEGLLSIDYRLKREGDAWVVYDIVLDGVSLLVDLRSQIQKVLREESYERLLERMREKLAEAK